MSHSANLSQHDRLNGLRNRNQVSSYTLMKIPAVIMEFDWQVSVCERECEWVYFPT